MPQDPCADQDGGGGAGGGGGGGGIEKSVPQDAWSSADFFFKKISGTLSECQTFCRA